MTDQFLLPLVDTSFTLRYKTAMKMHHHIIEEISISWGVERAV